MRSVTLRLLTVSFGFVAVCLLLSCGRNPGPENGMYRILPDKMIVKSRTHSGLLPVYRIVKGHNLVFSYNDVALPGNKNGRKMQSESIVFEVSPDSNRFYLKGASLDSSYAYYMVSDTVFHQYGVTTGYIKGSKIRKGSWKVNFLIKIDVDTGTVVKKLSHIFSEAPAIEQGATD